MSDLEEVLKPRQSLWRRFWRWFWMLDDLDDLERRLDALERRYEAIEAAAAMDAEDRKQRLEAKDSRWDTL